MKNKGIFKKKAIIAIIAVILAFVGAFSIKNLISSKADSTDTDAKYTASNIKNGAILQTFCWSFNSIKENIPKIKEAGFTAIQTSPISECIVGANGSKDLSNWYYHYQPISYKIGNYQLGTEEEFKSMCATAKANGIKVIVDVIPNHMTSTWEAIDPKYQKRDYYHTNVQISNWSSRYDVTQKALLGLWDVNTQSNEAKKNVLDYLKRCVADGASGFRYDTAKHIELPDEQGCGSDFWPTILNNGAEFQYGEVLHDGSSRDDAYAKYINITASDYGQAIRNGLKENKFNMHDLFTPHSEVANNRLVTWVESHDTFSNDEKISTSLTNEQIKLGWAFITARKDGTPLFFSRPVGAGGKNNDCRFPGLSKIGDAGDDFYKGAEITAVNIFRNEMEGEDEYIRIPNNDNRTVMIERGKKGAVLINQAYEDIKINETTRMINGEYKNKASNNNNVFNVSNGQISGTIPARSVVVLYKKNDGPIPTNTPTPEPSQSPEPGIKNKVYFEKPTSWGNDMYAYIYREENSTVEKISAWPGVKMSNVKDNVYSVEYDSKYNEASIIFTDKNTQVPGANQSGFTIKAKGLYTTNGYKQNYDEEKPPTPPVDNTVTIYYKSNWDNTNIHYKIGSKNWTTAPGVAMTRSEKSGYFEKTIELGDDDNLTACFNDGNNTWDNNNTKDYNLKAGIYTIENGVIKNITPQPVN